MGDFSAVIRIGFIDMFDGWHHGSMRHAITFQLVGDEPAWFAALAFEYPAKEPYSRFDIAATFHQNIKGITVLIHRSIPILALSIYGDKEFVDMPRIA